MFGWFRKSAATEEAVWRNRLSQVFDGLSDAVGQGGYGIDQLIKVPAALNVGLRVVRERYPTWAVPDTALAVKLLQPNDELPTHHAALRTLLDRNRSGSAAKAAAVLEIFGLVGGVGDAAAMPKTASSSGSNLDRLRARLSELGGKPKRDAMEGLVICSELAARFAVQSNGGAMAEFAPSQADRAVAVLFVAMIALDYATQLANVASHEAGLAILPAHIWKMPRMLSEQEAEAVGEDVGRLLRVGMFVHNALGEQPAGRQTMQEVAENFRKWALMRDETSPERVQLKMPSITKAVRTVITQL